MNAALRSLIDFEDEEQFNVVYNLLRRLPHLVRAPPRSRVHVLTVRPWRGGAR
jgi:hypothetical protein